MSPAGIATGFFRPAAALVGRLRYAHKFIVVGLVLLVPLGFVAKAYVDLQRSQIAFSAKERLGVEVIGPLLHLTDRVIEARHATVTHPADPPADLVPDLARMDAVERRLGPLLGFSGSWRSARAGILAAQVAPGGAEPRYAAYNRAVDALISLTVQVGDESNLTLDPDLDTYYLMDLLQFRLPVLLDTAGRIADQATLTAAQPVDRRTDGLIELGLHNGVLGSTRTAVVRDVTTIAAKTGDPGTAATVRVQLARLAPVAEHLDAKLTAAVKNRRVLAAPDASADELRSVATGFAAVAASELDRLLQARIDRFSDRERRIELVFSATALLAGYLFMGFYLSVMAPIRRIVGTLRAVAHGDLAQRVRVDTRDELSFVATVLNDTLAKTQLATARLAEQATRDALTALPNRALVLDRLQQALSRTRRTRRLMAVVFIDLDRFKIINDSLGHEAGDEVLRGVSARLRALVRASDTLGRLAGDEFVVVCEELHDVAEAVDIADRMITALSLPLPIHRHGGVRDVNVGASVGIAFADGAAPLAPADLLRDADVAMYRAKQRGRGRVEIFDDALRVVIESRLEVQDDLRRAIEAGQLRAHYQPIVDVAAGLVLGFEALARWEHPVRGLLGPGEFIAVAEETGLIVPLGATILAQACRQAAQWRSRPGGERLHMTVNVSSVQFGHPSFLATVAGALAESGLDPAALWLEITETCLMADGEATAGTLDRLRELGVRLAVDDFGTGYSSLTYLRRFPVDALKIDRSFVSGLGQDLQDEAIVSMVIGLARSLHLAVIAEGVETAGQLARLRHSGCTTVQGFLFGRPVPPETAWPMVAAMFGDRRAGSARDPGGAGARGRSEIAGPVLP
jgi:diguanylate cyclase (GGDEF)-like protein